MYLARINFKFSNSLINNKKEALEYANETLEAITSGTGYKLKLISLVKIKREKKRNSK